MHRQNVARAIATAAVIVVLGATAARAADPPPLGWKSTAELGWVQTGGNAKSGSFGFKFESIRTWDNAKLTFRGFAVKSKVTDVTRYGVLNPDSSVTLVEEENERVSAEQYRFFTDYEHRISTRLFWMASAGWERNEPAGISNRYLVAGGLGNNWIETATKKWKSQYLATYTREELVLGDANDFAGLRGGSDFWWKFATNAEYQNVFWLDMNVEDTDDWRAEMTNSVLVQMNKSLALKAALTVFYDNVPAFLGVPLRDPDGVPVPGADPVPFELDEFDYLFTTSLVISF